MVKHVTLLKITVVADDDTGNYQVGELDFGKTGHCEGFLATPENREKFVDWLRWLADSAEDGKPPFFPTGDKPSYAIAPEYMSGTPDST